MPLSLPQRLARALNAQPGELIAALAGFALFFCQIGRAHV